MSTAKFKNLTNINQYIANIKDEKKVKFLLKVS